MRHILKIKYTTGQVYEKKMRKQKHRKNESHIAKVIYKRYLRKM
jgi:hypothetical protein